MIGSKQEKTGATTRFRKFFGTSMLALAAVTAPLLSSAAYAQDDDSFSFVAYGDSRTMMYLPYTEAEADKVHAALVNIFALILGEKVALEVVKKDSKVTFDPETGVLTHVEMPFLTKTEVARLTFDKGWVLEATVEDTKLAPGVRTVMYRNYGGDWVGNGIVREVSEGGAKFVIDAGDVVWWGAQGKTLEESPYWQRMNNLVLSRLPAPDADMIAAGLEGRYYPTIGNHEVWDDPNIEGVLSSAPYLANHGVTSERLIYTFDFHDTRFIYLWTGKTDRFAPSGWDSTRPVYDEQLKQLKNWLDDAKDKDIRNIFVTMHAPVYNRRGFAPIPEDTNPHATLASYADDFAELVVFNAHVHTTELFEVDGVKYLVLGGGGAEQDPILPGRTSIARPTGYPEDLYWKNQAPKEEYNYLTVDVTPGEPSTFTLNRFRPTSATPFEEVTLFSDDK